ncbi:MAG TPA: glycosyltransferase, partial [Actinomycetota bacterium]|nr:glycosyltransferase [Actinomycetota bacterium]
VVVYTRRDDPTLPKRVKFAPGVTVEHVDAGPPKPLPKDELLPHMDAFAAELEVAWRTWRPDVAHAHFWMSAKASVAAGRRTGVPIVLTFHALGVVKRRHQGAKDTSPPERIAIEEALTQAVDHIVATSTDEVFELARLGTDPGRTSVIPCGVDLSLFRPDGPTERKTPGLDRVVVVSRLVERKGIGNIVTAMGRVPGAELLVAGGPESGDLARDAEARRFLRLAEEAGVADRVRLLGRVERDQVPALLRSADLVACTPWYEPFGMVAVEAMACGVPVVASAVGGLVDTVVEGVPGLHVRPRASDSIAEAIRRLLADPEIRAEMGRRGAARAAAQYGWDRIARLTLQVYTSVVERSAAAVARTTKHGRPS